jgi:ectonucleotide pyrophosphatase/phosphodiesterase family protein 5
MNFIAKSFILILCAFVLVFAADEKPYLILISFDGFRWDYPNLGITPNLDKIRANGVKALSLQSVFPSKTFPNHYSIVTGLYPQNHGIVTNHFENEFTGEMYRLGDTSSVRSDKWYHGETIWATAKKQGIRTASYFWPGSETALDYKHPDYFHHYDENISYDTRIQGVIDWLKLPESERPHMILLYFEETDTYGHRSGPLSERNLQAISLLDTKLGLLSEKLDEINLGKKVNIILVSDHGMTDISPEKIVVLQDYFPNEIPPYFGSGPMVQFYEADLDKQNKIYSALKKHEHNFKVYHRSEIPEYFHYNASPFIGDIVVIAEPGYSIIEDREVLVKAGANYSRGNHGWDNHMLDMHGIFYAIGPAFKAGYQCGTLLNIDIYPLMCKILEIIPNQNIDGDLSRIEFLLK